MEIVEKESFFENGNPEYRVTYDFKNQRNNMVFFYENGQVKWRGRFNHGKEDGEWIYYFEDGKVFCRENWKNGVKVDCFLE